MNIEKRLNDKRVKKVLVLDTETTVLDKSKGFSEGNQIVFDFGYIICDKKGNKLIKKSYLIDEVFTNQNLMAQAYYYSKYPTYLRGLSNGDFKIEKWFNILTELLQFIEKYDIREVYAYNVAFDLQALKNTNIHLRGKRFGLFDDMAVNCIWGMSVETICQQKTFKRLVRENNLYTQSGKYYSTSAETVYKYITNDWEFKESHTGLQDVEIEVEILAKCFRTHKKMSKGVVQHPFRFAKIEN